MRLEKISEEEILERFSEASTDGNNTKYISGSLLTGIARYIQALKSHVSTPRGLSVLTVSTARPMEQADEPGSKTGFEAFG